MRFLRVRRYTGQPGNEWIATSYAEPGIYESPNGLFLAIGGAPILLGVDLARLIETEEPKPLPISQGTAIDLNRLFDQLSEAILDHRKDERAAFTSSVRSEP